ncbi:MAG: alpha/beta hydrolase [Thaumarchaeota archaeon]|nr:alpha/beta hydrolase [Nitrososphaerota archaeon]
MNYDNRSISFGSVHLGYRVEGEGARKIVLLHGLNSHSGTWRKNISALARDSTVVAPSLPPNRSGEATSELAGLYADHVSAVCADAGIEGAAVVGNSMGGWVAMRLLSVHRELVSRVVLEDTAGSGSDDVRVLEASAIPVLIVWGGSDLLLPVSAGLELHSRLSGSELRVIPNAGHVPHWETPEEFNGAVGTFLRQRVVR